MARKLLLLVLVFMFVPQASHAQISDGVNLVGAVDPLDCPMRCYSDVWGYDGRPDGKLLALLLSGEGVIILDVTDPSAPVAFGEPIGIPPFSTAATRRADVKVSGHYAYVVYQTPGSFTPAPPGLQIIDLDESPGSMLVSPAPAISSRIDLAHNLFIDGGRLYIFGAEDFSTMPIAQDSIGTYILDLTDPEDPDSIGWFDDDLAAGGFYIHDGYVRNDTLYAAAVKSGFVGIIDVSDPGNPTVLKKFSWPGNAAHSCELTPDGNFLVGCSELGDGNVHILDVSDIENIHQVSTFSTGEAHVHNPYIVGDLLYLAYNDDGLRVVDIMNPSAPYEAGFYDTALGGTDEGVWGAFPFTTSGDVYVGDREKGLFVLNFSTGLVSGSVTDDVTGAPLPQADVSLVTGPATRPTSSGNYRLYATEQQPWTLVVGAYGYVTDQVQVTLDENTPLTQNFQLTPLPNTTISGTVVDPFGNGLDNVEIELSGSPLSTTSLASGQYTLAGVLDGSYLLTYSLLGYATHTEVLTITGAPAVINVTLFPDVYSESFESGQNGWTVTTTATGGAWVLDDPTSNAVGLVQTGDDHTLGASGHCFVTGNSTDPELRNGAHDVDGGSTILTSPTFDISGVNQPHVSYWLWYFNGEEETPSSEPFTVEILGDGVVIGTHVQTASTGEWQRFDFRISDLPQGSPLPDDLEVRFTAQDFGGGDDVEALIDDFSIYEECPGTGSVIESNMSAWAEEAPFPNQMELHFNFFTTTKAWEFEVRYRVKQRSPLPWTDKSCSLPSSSCLFFNPNGSYEATAIFGACATTKFEWQARFVGCDEWSNWSNSKFFTALCLTGPPMAERDTTRPQRFEARATILPGGAGAQFTIAVPDNGEFDLRIYDVKGRQVELVTSEVVVAGLRQFNWRATGPTGGLVPSGIYFYRARLGSQILTGRIPIIR